MKQLSIFAHDLPGEVRTFGQRTFPAREQNSPAPHSSGEFPSTPPTPAFAGSGMALAETALPAHPLHSCSDQCRHGLLSAAGRPSELSSHPGLPCFRPGRSGQLRPSPLDRVAAARLCEPHRSLSSLLSAFEASGREQVKGIQWYPEIVLKARLRSVLCGNVGNPPSEPPLTDSLSQEAFCLYRFAKWSPLQNTQHANRYSAASCRPYPNRFHQPTVRHGTKMYVGFRHCS